MKLVKKLVTHNSLPVSDGEHESATIYFDNLNGRLGVSLAIAESASGESYESFANFWRTAFFSEAQRSAIAPFGSDDIVELILMFVYLQTTGSDADQADLNNIRWKALHKSVDLLSPSLTDYVESLTMAASLEALGEHYGDDGRLLVQRMGKGLRASMIKSAAGPFTEFFKATKGGARNVKLTCTDEEIVEVDRLRKELDWKPVLRAYKKCRREGDESKWWPTGDAKWWPKIGEAELQRSENSILRDSFNKLRDEQKNWLMVEAIRTEKPSGMSWLHAAAVVLPGVGTVGVTTLVDRLKEAKRIKFTSVEPIQKRGKS